MTHYFFLQSVASPEYEAGKVLFEHLLAVPNVNGRVYSPFEAKSLQDMERFVNNIIATVNANDKIDFYVDIHSDDQTFTFKDVLSQNRLDFTEYHPWECLDDMVNILYENYGRNIHKSRKKQHHCCRNKDNEHHPLAKLGQKNGALG